MPCYSKKSCSTKSKSQKINICDLDKDVCCLKKCVCSNQSSITDLQTEITNLQNEITNIQNETSCVEAFGLVLSQNDGMTARFENGITGAQLDPNTSTLNITGVTFLSGSNTYDVFFESGAFQSECGLPVITITPLENGQDPTTVTESAVVVPNSVSLTGAQVTIGAPDVSDGIRTSFYINAKQACC